ncbi:MAG: hypothetical protein C0501_12510 [Isosphaera sp.]|nr:hypothetical protein [Isosphaera sp.]
MPRATPALAALLGLAGLVGGAARPPAEEEDPKGGVKKRVVVDDGPDTAKATPAAPVGNPPDVRLDELARAADEARTPELKAFFARHLVPFDRVSDNTGTFRVKPIPFRRAEFGQAESITVAPLDAANRPQPAKGVAVANVRGVEHFELIAAAEADALVKAKAEPGADNLAAAEKLLAAALRFHDYARERQLRRGKTWDEVRTPLAAKLREVRLEQLKAAVAVGDPVRVRDAGTRLMAAYPKDPAVVKAVGATRVAEADRLLASASHADHLRAKGLLDEFEDSFPGAGGEAAAALRVKLREMAAKAFTRAKDKKAAGDLTTARDELTRAAALDPTVEGIRDLQRELRTGYPILRVAARQFPEKMSPATARLDSEKQAVELLFEGLLEEVPDENGSVRYRPGAALTLPAVVPGGREFLLRAYERDPTGRPGVDTNDLVGTVRLLGARPDTWAGYPLPWLGGLPDRRDAQAVRVPFAAPGHPDPRSALTFKLLPAKWLADNGKPADDPAFAERPYGTGPFRLQPTTQPAGAREMVFVDNPVYGRWRDRTGLPQLREVRLVELGGRDPVEEFKADRLHVLTDVPTADLAKYAALGGRVRVVTAAVNRRVHVLAVNLRRPDLQNKALRQGLSMAIDRKGILDAVFRAGKDEYHKPMTGPYPPNSWADPRAVGGPEPLFKYDLATARVGTYLAGAAPRTAFELAYPDDDAKAEEACRRIKAQVEGLTKDAPAGRRLVINLVRVSPRELATRVQDEHRYDLAYVPFDYPDDWHPFGLGAALDKDAGGRGGRNWFGFLQRDTNPDAEDLRLGQLLTELRGYRDVAGQLAPRAGEAGRLFNDCVPFIPLWQLDRHTVVHSSLKVFVDDAGGPVNPRVLNPTTLFQGVARWRLE